MTLKQNREIRTGAHEEFRGYLWSKRRPDSNLLPPLNPRVGVKMENGKWGQSLLLTVDCLINSSSEREYQQ